MGISEFTVHNVLRTYSRQERLGQIHKAKANTSVRGSGDRVSLTSTGQKLQWIGHLAAEVVEQRHAGLGPEEWSVKVRSTKEELLRRHHDEISEDSVTPGAFEEHLRALYLD